MDFGYSNILIKAQIKNKLESMKMEHESFGAVIQRLINFWEQNHPPSNQPHQKI